MIVLPAIDIKDGECVRLRQGLKDEKTVYAKDPVEMARKFKEMGAEFLHIVDLDGAFEGEPENIEIIERIAREVDLPFEIGGGIRTLDTAKRYIDAGASRIIIGTKAVEDMDFIKKLIDLFGDRVAVSLDAKGSEVLTKGWVESGGVDVIAKAKELEDMGLKVLIYTDVTRDGMLTGPNFDMLGKLSSEVGMDIVASGGIAGVEHLDTVEDMDLYGAIVGKAIYENQIDLEEYLKKQRERNAG